MMTSRRRPACALLALFALGLISSCSAPASPTPFPTATETRFRTWTPIPTLTPSRTLTPSLTPTITPTVPTPTLSAEQMTDQAAVVAINHLTWVDDIGNRPMPLRFRDFSFYESLGGWVTGFVPSGQWELGHTVDGGRTWHAVSLPRSCESSGDVTILFSSPTVGWAKCQILWSTGDGGATWQVEMLASQVINWGRTPAGVYWAAVELVDGVHLFELIDQRATAWHEFASLPKEWTLTGLSEPASIPVVIGDPEHIWVYVGVRRKDGTIAFQGWHFTEDGGQRWDRRELPCGSGAWGLDTGIALAPDGTLWSQCWGIPGGMFMPKSYWQSDDGGLTWREIARSPFPGSAPVEEAALLPFSGISWRLDVFNAHFAYSLLGRVDAPLITRDGGRSWHTPWLSPCLFFDGAASGEFVDDLHGYFASLDGMARTADGGLTWECLLYPTPSGASAP